MSQFIYSIFDGSPCDDGQVWPHKEHVEFSSDEGDDVEAMAIELLESAALGCQSADYEVDDRISIIVWVRDEDGNPGAIAVQRAHRLTAEDLGIQ